MSLNIKREDVLEVLGKITDPDLKKDLVSANLVEQLTIKDSSIQLSVVVSNPALHARKRMQEAIVFNLKRKFGDNTSVDCNVSGMSAEQKELDAKFYPMLKTSSPWHREKEE